MKTGAGRHGVFTATATVWNLLAAHAKLRPHAVAIEEAGRAPLTYQGLIDHVERTGRALRRLGIGPQDRVALALPDGSDAAVAFLSVASAAVAAPLNSGDRAGTFALNLKRLSTRAVVVPRGSAGAAVDGARACGIAVIEIAQRGDLAGAFDLLGERNAQATAAPVIAAPRDLAVVLQTSGTTRGPKIVPLTHANICASARNNVDLLQLGTRDRSLAVMPLFHIHGLVRAVLAPLAAGGTVICTSGFEAHRFIGWLQEHEPTWYTACPAVHQAILDHAVRGSIPVPSRLRLIRTGAAAMPTQLQLDLERVFGVPVIAGYGMTETSGQITSNPLPPQVRKPGSVGRAAGPEVAVVDERGLQLGPGHIGEIVVRGPSVMNGYEDDPELNAEVFANGWFRTGDQGYRDKDGYVFLTGRLKEIINRGGEKIAPAEVDRVLLEHPSVAQAVTFGVPDSNLGEAVAAAVVPKPGARLTAGELREFAATHLPFCKVPCQIFLLAELPTGLTGKLRRADLAALLPATGDSDTMHGAAPLTQCPSHDDGGNAARRAPTAVEAALLRIWADTLTIPEVGLHDDFFELGGNSISAVQILFQIRQAFDVDLRADILFRAPTVCRLSEKIEHLRRSTAPLASRSDPAHASSSTERRLAAIWEEVLDIRPIGPRDNFFELGGQSSHVDRVLAAIERVFGEGLPARALLDTPTVEGLARTIDGTEGSESLLVALRSQGRRPPLFAIHAGAGYVFFYRSLAFRIRGDFPMYAVQAQGHVGGRRQPYAPATTVEQLAARYLREIRSVQRHGPYNLAGASFGGILAFEMARQLLADGERVNTLFLFSPHIRNNPHRERDDATAGAGRRRWRRCVSARSVWHAAKPRFQRKIDQIRAECEWRWRVLRQQPIPAEWINARFMTASRSLAARYRPGDYDGRAILFRAATDEDPVPLWSGLTRDGLEIHDTPGGHLEMLNEPTVATVAEIIRANIERSDQATSSDTEAIRRVG